MMVNSGAAQRRPWVVGNWKMHGSMVENEGLLSALLGALDQHPKEAPIARCAVAVPFPYLFQAAVRLKGHSVGWGAQDVSAEEQGAFTGEVSVAMLQDFEAQFALVGHSERRGRWGESDAVVAAKAVRVALAGLTPVVCVGESLAVRDQGQAIPVVCGQVRAVAARLAEEKSLDSAVIAYEPIWAIGTGDTCDPQEANRVISIIRQQLSNQNVSIQYGGSVKPDNIDVIMAQPEIDGALVGGASLDPNGFGRIVNYE